MNIDHKYRVYWDACVWIAWSNKQREAENHNKCLEVLREVEAGKAEMILTPLVIAEFVPNNDPKVDEQFKKYLQHSSFKYLTINRFMGDNARELMRKYRGLQGPDALHLSCAIFSKAQYLHTFDNGLLRIAGSVTDIKICNPVSLMQDNEGMLFKGSD